MRVDSAQAAEALESAVLLHGSFAADKAVQLVRLSGLADQADTARIRQLQGTWPHLA